MAPDQSICVPVGAGWDCSLGYEGVAVPDSAGHWIYSDAKRNTWYHVYGVNESDGKAVLSAPATVQTPMTITGCNQYSAIQLTVPEDLHSSPPLPGPNIGLKNGAIAGIRIEPKGAVDALFGGFVQQALWVGIDDESLAVEWIETGVTQGAEIAPNVFADTHRYFTAWGEANGGFAFVLLPGTPPVGQVQFFKTVTCDTTGSGFFELGCPSGQPTPNQWVTCANTGQFGDNLGACFPWTAAKAAMITGEPEDAFGRGSADLQVGLEATCRLNSLDTAKAQQIRYRENNVSWVSIDALDWRRTWLAKAPAPSTIHGTDCCHGVITGPGASEAECVPPKDFIFFLNSETPTAPQQACN